MIKLKWVKPDENNLPPKDVQLLIKYKHGIISGFWDYDEYENNKTFIFTAYAWREIQGYIYEYISMDAFNSVFLKDGE